MSANVDVEVGLFARTLLTPRAPEATKRLPTRLRRALSWVLFNLLPSFVQRELYPSLKSRNDTPLSHTAFLDGIRGVASLFVYFHHLYFVTHNVKHAYGKENDSLSSLPIIRLLICGHSIVSLFFVVSGFALSVRPLKLMRRHEWKELHHALSSSVVRRGLRLYLPCIASTLIILVLLRLRVYENAGRDIANNPHLLTKFREKHPVREKTLGREFHTWFMQLLGLFNPWTKSSVSWHPRYDTHLWSIATEFRASIMLFVVQLGVSRLIPTVRRLCLLVLIFWGFGKFWWTPVQFFSGFLIADFDCNFTVPTSFSGPTTPLLASGKRTHSLPGHIILWRRFRRQFWILVFFFGTYCASAPAEHYELTTGFKTLAKVTPSMYENAKPQFWNTIGVILIVAASTNSQGLKNVFTSRPVQYLGRISFAVYLVHGMTIHTFGYACMKTSWRWTGFKTEGARERGFYMAAAITTLGIFWFADVFTQMVDMPSQRLARWVENVCTIKEIRGDDEDFRRRFNPPAHEQREISNSSKRRWSLERSGSIDPYRLT